MLYGMSRTREADRVRFREQHMDGVDKGWERIQLQGDKVKGFKAKILCLVTRLMLCVQ